MHVVLDLSSSVQLSSVINVAVEFQSFFLPDAWGVVTEYWWFTGKWNHMSTPTSWVYCITIFGIVPNCNLTWLDYALCLLIWLCGCSSHWLYFSYLFAALPANEENGEHSPSRHRGSHGCREKTPGRIYLEWENTNSGYLQGVGWNSKIGL